MPATGRFPCPIAVHLAGPDEAACPLFVGRAHPRRPERAEPALAAGSADGDRPPADLGAGRHHQFPHLRSSTGRSTSSTPISSTAISSCAARGRGETLAALNGKSYALDPEMTVIADRDGLEPGRRHRRREQRLHRGDVERLSSRRRSSIPCAPPRPGASCSCRAMRAIASSAASIPNSCGPGSRSRRGSSWRSAAARRARSRVAGAVPAWRRQICLCARARPRASAASTCRGASSAILARARLCRRGRRGRRSPSSRPPGAATSRARPISSRKCCASTATTTFPPCRCRATPSLPRPGARRRRSAAPASCAAASPRAVSIEAVTFSFMPRAARRALRRRRPRACALVNPISADLDAMRPSLLPNLLRGGAAQRRSRLRRRRALRGRPAIPRRHARRPGSRRGRRARRAHRGPSAGTIRGRAGRCASSPRPTRSRRWPRRGVVRERCRSAPTRPPGTTPAAPAVCGSAPKLLGLVRRAPSGRARRRWASKGRRWASRSSSTPCRCRARGAGAAAAQALALPAGRARFRLRRRSRTLAGRDAAARGARRRQDAHRRGAALRRLYRPGHRRGQEVARDHRGAAARGGDAHRRRRSRRSRRSSSRRSRRRRAGCCGGRKEAVSRQLSALWARMVGFAKSEEPPRSVSAPMA